MASENNPASQPYKKVCTNTDIWMRKMFYDVTERFDNFSAIDP